MKKKPFDCVEMKRKGAARVYEKVKDLSREEELEFWKRGTEELRKQADEQKKKPTTPSS